MNLNNHNSILWVALMDSNFNKNSQNINKRIPQRVYVLPGTYFANPKSLIFMYPSDDIKVFSGFKSLNYH